MKTQPRLRWLERASLLAGVGLLALWSGNFFESHGYQSLESRRLDAARRGGGDSITATPPRGTGRGEVLGRIEIPRLGITAIVAEGTDDATLKRAVGHVTSTALPGRPGNCALAGHRDTFFLGLGEVREDDLIRVVAPDRTLTYRVEWTVVVEPRRVDLLDSTDTPALTLVTCYPFRYVGRAPKRFVVRAVQVESIAIRHEPSVDAESAGGRTSLKQPL